MTCCTTTTPAEPIPGPVGARGPRGYTGNTGPAGNDGDDGAPGQDGDTLDKVYNVTDYDTPSLAVATAYADGAILNWPSGTHTSLVNIPNLHKVRHIGNGWLNSNGYTFYPDPQSNRKNTLYVSPGGLSTNDGLSPQNPLEMQSALNSLENYGPTLGGWWVIQLAAGTYSGGYATPYMNKSRRAVEIRGVDMGGPRITPTVIFDRGVSPSIAWGFVTSNMKISIYDIKFINFNLYDHTIDGANAGAIRLDAYSDGNLWNIHVDVADFGIYVLNHSTYTIQGSYIKNCRGMGITELWHVTRATSGNTGDRNIIENCKYGLKAKELCTGHGDYNEYINCDYAIHLSRASTINASSSIFRQNDYCVVTAGYSSWVDLYCTYGTGVDANGPKHVNVPTANMRAGAENYFVGNIVGLAPKMLGFGSSTAITNSTADTKICDLGAFLSMDFQAKGSWVEWKAFGTTTQVSGTTVLRLRIGGTTGVSVTLPTGTYDWKFEGRMFVTANGDVQQINGWLTRTTGNPLSSRAARAVAFSTAGYGFGIYSQAGGLTDTITCDQGVMLTSEL